MIRQFRILRLNKFTPLVRGSIADYYPGYQRNFGMEPRKDHAERTVAEPRQPNIYEVELSRITPVSNTIRLFRLRSANKSENIIKASRYTSLPLVPMSNLLFLSLPHSSRNTLLLTCYAHNTVPSRSMGRSIYSWPTIPRGLHHYIRTFICSSQAYWSCLIRCFRTRASPAVLQIGTSHSARCSAISESTSPVAFSTTLGDSPHRPLCATRRKLLLPSLWHDTQTV